MKKILVGLLMVVLAFVGVSLTKEKGVEEQPKEEFIEITVEEPPYEPVEVVNEADKVLVKVMSKPYVDEFWHAYSVDVYVENLSDETVFVAFTETSVNDCMIEPYFTIEVAPGKKANEAVKFMKDDLDRNDIKESFDKLAFKVATYNDSWDTLFESKEVNVEFNK